MQLVAEAPAAEETPTPIAEEGVTAADPTADTSAAVLTLEGATDVIPKTHFKENSL